VEALHEGNPAPPDSEAAVAALFAARYAEMVRLAGLLGADDAEDVAQEAFARLLNRHAGLRDPGAAIGYVRATVCNLTRNRRRHLSVARRSAPPGLPEAGATLEQAVIVREDHGEVLAAVAALPRRQREAVVLRYWLELSAVLPDGSQVKGAFWGSLVQDFYWQWEVRLPREYASATVTLAFRDATGRVLGHLAVVPGKNAFPPIGHR
jgi:DNA-directed RNA polymerase specialized sigma24 family protein